MTELMTPPSASNCLLVKGAGLYRFTGSKYPEVLSDNNDIIIESFYDTVCRNPCTRGILQRPEIFRPQSTCPKHGPRHTQWIIFALVSRQKILKYRQVVNGQPLNVSFAYSGGFPHICPLHSREHSDPVRPKPRSERQPR